MVHKAAVLHMISYLSSKKGKIVIVLLGSKVMYIKFSIIGGFLRVFVTQNCSRNKKRTKKPQKTIY